MNGLSHEPYYSSHYAQAYLQQKNTPATSTDAQRMPSRQSADAQRMPSRPHAPGNHRCTYKNCGFTGSLQTLQVHRMDRHLIYPPGWSKKKKEEDWDADPSLKG